MSRQNHLQSLDGTDKHPQRDGSLPSDVRRYTGKLPVLGPRLIVSTAFRQPGFIAVALYRWQTRLLDAGHTRRAQFIYQINLAITNADLLPGSYIGPGLMIRHATGIVIGAGARVGSQCTILQGVTLGASDPTATGAAAYPLVGDGVTIGAGAVLIGGIVVGDGATIGAGAVVIKDVEPGTTVVGNPARPVSRSSN